MSENLQRWLRAPLSTASTPIFKGVDGKESKAIGETTIETRIGNSTRMLTFVVASSCPTPILLGGPAIVDFEMIIDLSKNQIQVDDQIVKLEDSKFKAIVATTKIIAPHSVQVIQLQRMGIGKPGMSILYSC